MADHPKNKTFFFGVFERLDDAFPEPGRVLGARRRAATGDFSALLSQGITIYDPATAFTNSAGRVERLPFPGNVILSDRLSPIAQPPKYYPAPNQAGDAQARTITCRIRYAPTTSSSRSTVRGDHQFSQNSGSSSATTTTTTAPEARSNCRRNQREPNGRTRFADAEAEVTITTRCGRCRWGCF